MLYGRSILEVLLRVQEPDIAGPARSARYVADAFETFDYVNVGEVERLRAVAALRDAVARGAAHDGVRDEDVALIVRVAGRLSAAAAIPAAE